MKELLWFLNNFDFDPNEFVDKVRIQISTIISIIIDPNIYENPNNELFLDHIPTPFYITIDQDIESVTW